jgi:16S rRNA (guanine527-N7)-methyltransferase
MDVDLTEILLEAQARGLVGSREVSWHIAHAERYIACVPRDARCLDLGSGGGLPGLPVAVARPDLVLHLVDARDRSVQWLRLAVARLGIGTRVQVIHSRAEALVGSGLGDADVVLARGFGPPADLAECAAPLLRVGGRLVVSAVDDGSEWSSDGLARLGFAAPAITQDEYGAMVVTVLQSTCPPGFPRRPKARADSPLW